MRGEFVKAGDGRQARSETFLGGRRAKVRSRGKTLIFSFRRVVTTSWQPRPPCGPPWL